MVLFSELKYIKDFKWRRCWRFGGDSSKEGIGQMDGIEKEG